MENFVSVIANFGDRPFAYRTKQFEKYLKDNQLFEEPPPKEEKPNEECIFFILSHLNQYALTAESLKKGATKRMFPKDPTNINQMWYESSVLLLLFGCFLDIPG